MKLRNKLLVALAPAATIATITPIALTSCNNGSNSISYNGETSLTSSEKTFTMEFALTNELSTGQTLSVSASGTMSGFIVGPKSTTPVVSGKKVTVTMSMDSPTSGATAKFGLTFTCRDDSYTELWTKKFDGFSVKYSA